MDTRAFDEAELWFLVGSQHLYGERVLEQVAEHAAAIVAELDAAPAVPVPIRVRPVLTDAAAIHRAILEANASDSCAGVVAWMHTFSPAKMWIAGMRDLQKPLLHLHTQFGVDLPWAEIDMDFMNLHQSAHGDREFAHVLTRLGIDRVTLVGHWRDSRLQERLGIWARAAAAVSDARRLRIARFGDNMRDVAVTEGDKVEAQLRFGFSVNTYGINDLVAANESVADSAVGDLVDEYVESYDVDAVLQPAGDRHESLRQAARIELGLRAFLDDGGFGAFTDTFEDLGALPQLPGIAVQRLMADGFGFGAEGDWKTAALVRMVKTMSVGLPGGTSFMEDYTYHLEPSLECVLGAHMLEVCPTIASDRPSCEIHPLTIGGREDPVRLVFTAPPGPGWVVGMADLGDRFRLVANTVDVIDPREPLERLPVARAVWEPRPTLSVAASGWLRSGGPHHTCFTQAVPLAALEDVSRMTGVELLVIDEDSTERSIEQELRWNLPAYREHRSR
jgi:L-arabinose isomerase